MNLSSSADSVFAVHFGPNFEMTFTNEKPSSHSQRPGPYSVRSPYYSAYMGVPPSHPSYPSYLRKSCPPSSLNVTGVVNITKNGVQSSVSNISINQRRV